MGAVRIYKDTRVTSFPWQLRSGGCSVVDSLDCNYGSRHGGVCSSFMSFKGLVLCLNDTELRYGAYLKK